MRKLTDSERATALRNNINWAIEYNYRVDNSISKQMDYLDSKDLSFRHLPTATRDLNNLMDQLNYIKELIENDEVYSYD
tara:strand:+ start:243 stop:479 length:237 start_codon:yes stop_codon:yes gene_type:complete